LVSLSNHSWTLNMKTLWNDKLVSILALKQTFFFNTCQKNPRVFHQEFEVFPQLLLNCHCPLGPSSVSKYHKPVISGTEEVVNRLKFCFKWWQKQKSICFTDFFKSCPCRTSKVFKIFFIVSPPKMYVDWWCTVTLAANLLGLILAPRSFHPSPFDFQQFPV